MSISYLVTKSRFETMVAGDLTAISNIAEDVIANEIRLIKEQANSTARLVSYTAVEELPAILDQEFKWYRYQNLVVADRNGVLASYNEIVQPDEYFQQSDYVMRAFMGESVIGTSEYSLEGELIFRTWVPAGPDRVLMIALSGLNFYNIIKDFRIWQTGNVFVLDHEGTSIAYVDPAGVLARENFVKLMEGANTGPGVVESSGTDLAAFLKKMVQGGSGIGRYSFGGAERICAYTEVEGSEGWVLGASAPIAESPLSQLNQVLLMSALAFLVLGFFAASIAAKNVAMPYEHIQRQNLRLADLKQTAETASEAKTNFLANMSHEMRTPLNAIIGLSELELGTEELPEETNNNIEKIYNSGMTLLGIINDLLDISKVESGKFDLIPVEYDIPSLINDTVTLNVVRIGSKPIEFHLHIDENLPTKIMGDELRVKQIFNNLLTNAFKYTESGTVDWYLSCETVGDDMWITSSVTDTGIGIRAEDISKLFTDYNQVDTKSNRRLEGTGLGLSITKRLVELMDGVINVKSEYGKGSAFTVRFRQGAVDSSAIGKETAQNLADFRYFARRRRKNERLARAYIPYAAVLVVDDVVTNLDVARGMMKPYGMVIDCVTSGREAVDLIRKEEVKYNAIFMDHMMPDMDGIEAARVIREDIGTEYARTVPIIALTANAIVGNEEMFLRHGFQAFLAKPIDIMRLDMVINDFVRDKNQERALKMAPSPEESREANREYRLLQQRKIPGLNILKGLKRFNGNIESYLAILRSYVKNTPAVLESIRDVSSGALPLSLYSVKVHGIKGSSYGISADAAGNMAKELEDAANGSNANYVNFHNGPFIELVETLVGNIREFLEEIDKDTKRPLRPAPDPALLEAILNASRNYDMDCMDKAVLELAQYRYESRGELVEWLREKTGRSAFEEIEKRLSGEL
jgi:signal transduction histidine kinase/CheY-like chemotaxis protein